MTLKEAKKILKKECFGLCVNFDNRTEFCEMPEWEKPEVVEAKKIVNQNGLLTVMTESECEVRKARLNKQYEDNTRLEGSSSGEIPIEHDGEPIPGPTLHEGAKEFYGALLDEQKKQIDELNRCIENQKDEIASMDASFAYKKSEYEDKIKSLGNEISRLEGVICKMNARIKELRKESSKHLRDKIKAFYENQDLEKKVDRIENRFYFAMKKVRQLNKDLSDKDAVLSDVSEELRFSLMRHRTAYESCVKKNEEIERLKKAHDKNRKASTKAVAIYVDAVTKAELDGLLLDFWENDGEKITAIYQLKNGKRSKLCLDFTGEKIVFSRSDPDKKPAPGEGFTKLQEKAVKSYNEHDKMCKDFMINAGYKGGKGILDQMEIKVDLGKGKSPTHVACLNPNCASQDESLEAICKKCEELGIDVHYHVDQEPTYTNVFGDEIPVTQLRNLFAL